MDALEDAIVAAPNDASRYAVLADALAQQGDAKDTGEFSRLKALEPKRLARVRELEGLRLTLPTRGLSIDMAVWLRQHVKVQFLGAPGATTANPEALRTTWRELGRPGPVVARDDD